MPLDTLVTQILGVKTPIIGAPMAGASGGLLAAEVTAGGGFGFLGAGYRNVESIKNEISLVRAALRLDPSDTLPIGVGYLAWQLEQPTAKPEELLAVALDSHVQAIWLSFGNHLETWIQFVRKYDAEHKRVRPTTIFVPVGSVEQALVAANEWKVDVLVAQGIESGGHGYDAAPPVFTLVSSILAALPKDGPPVLAAGGIATGAQVASFLVLGAAGVVLGTRLLMTPESLYNDAQKKALVAATSDKAVRTMAFDHARGTLGWPAGVDGRALYNETVKDVDSGVDMGIVKQRFEEGVRASNPDRLVIWSGTGVGLVSEIKSAKEVVQELHREILQRLKVASELA